MIVVAPSAELLSITPDAERLIELAGRTDYASNATSDPTIITRWIAAGHESMIEMGHAVFRIKCSRVVSHELVRHRLASFQQESQRYVRYDNDLPVVVPEGLTEEQSGAVSALARHAHQVYAGLIADGVKPQLARYVLPNATATTIVVGANFREWRHIIKLRLHKSAQPEIQEIARQILAVLVAHAPLVFGDITGNERGVR